MDHLPRFHGNDTSLDSHLRPPRTSGSAWLHRVFTATQISGDARSMAGDRQAGLSESKEQGRRNLRVPSVGLGQHPCKLGLGTEFPKPLAPDRKSTRLNSSHVK